MPEDSAPLSVAPSIHEPGNRKSPLPQWYPAWARELAELYFSGTTCLFVLHGNIHDLIRSPSLDGEKYSNLSEFLATQVFGSWDAVLLHDLAHGLRPLAGSDRQRLQAMVHTLGARIGDPSAWPRDADAILALLDRLVERTLIEEDDSRRLSMAVIFDSAQYLVPLGDLTTLARGQSANLVRFLGWAQNPYIKRHNMAFCLVVDKLSEVNPRLLRSPHVAAIEVPLPDAGQRRHFCEQATKKEGSVRPEALAASEVAELSNGLSLVNLEVLLAQAASLDRNVDADRFRRHKKSLIERQCQDLLEFVEPEHTLDLVAGQRAAKDRLRQDAELICRGRLDVAPMGYLLCGPVGTGKTFLAEAYAGSIGIPCVKLRNFRSKYVGETEGNLEQMLGVLRSLGPVVVIIDEADAALGTRQAEGDSGTSSRVFGMIAAQMGDTRYRGRIVWMLLTSRPDLLPIDLKRQGRAEVHLPLFYPRAEAEVQEMMLAMAQKNKIQLQPSSLPPVSLDRRLSGSDIESILLTARRRALTQGQEHVRREDILAAWDQFLPSAQGLEKELQELSAVLECTELEFLPEDWRELVSKADGRLRLQRRFRKVLRRLGQ